MFFAGVVILVYMGLYKFIFGYSLSDRPLFMIGIFFTLLGVQFLALGIMADILLKIYYGQNGRKNYLVDRVLN